MIDQMRAHVSERADAKRKPTTPVERVVDRMVRNVFGDGTDVQIPAESGRHGIGAHRRSENRVYLPEAPRISERTRRRRWRRTSRRPRDSLWPIHHWPVRPYMHLVNRPNNPRLHPLVNEARAVARVALVS